MSAPSVQPSPKEKQPSQANSTPSQADAFVQQAEETAPGLLREFLDFLVCNKAWWITPIIIVLLLVGLLIFLSPAAAPFIYPLF